MFSALTSNATLRWRRSIALRACGVSALILFCFAIFGKFLLLSLGISLSSLKIAGGILLLLIAIDMVFVTNSGGTSTTREEDEEAAHQQDTSVFPLAMPLIAGPGSLGAILLLITEASGKPFNQLLIFAAMLSVLAITLTLMLLANKVEKLLGITSVQVIGRIFGILLAALAVQFIIDGLLQGPLFAVD